MTTGKELGAQPAMPFSRIEEQVSAKYAFSTGVTKRELFAALAMQGLLANPVYAEQARAGDTSGTAASAAVWHADELLDELAKDAQS